MRKVVCALLLAALAVVPASAANRYGLKEPLRDLSYLKANPPQVSIAEDLPAKFDLRDLGVVPVAVRQQNPWGTCWAHATMGACESNYLLKVHNGGENFLNVTAQDVDLSELHLVYFVYKAPKGYEHMVFSIVNKDTELLIQDPAPDDTLGAGGTWTQAAALLSRGLGPVMEATLPYTLVNSEGDDGEIDFKEFLAKVQGKGPWDFPSVLRMTDAAYVADATGEAGRARVKELIRTNGGMLLSYMDSNLGRWGAPCYSYYCPESVSETDKNAGPHAVLAVGWDDAFPKENFPTGHQPSIDGAWLIRNSWGSDATDHDGGYFWMSYEQPNLRGASFAVGKPDEGLQLYEHDPLGWIENWGAGKTACAVNVFRADSGGTLTEVGFYTTDNNAQVEIYVNANYGTTAPAASSVQLGERVASQTFPYAGYHTVKLENPVALTKDGYFSVGLRATNPSQSLFSTF